MKKCRICGIVKKVTINCNRCGNESCLHCFYLSEGICSECIIMVYNEAYHEIIKAYAQSIAT